MSAKSTTAYEREMQRDEGAAYEAGLSQADLQDAMPGAPELPPGLRSLAEMLPSAPVERRMRREREAFGEFHPAVNFVFFAAAIVLSMCLRHPVFLACGFVLSFTYYLLLHGRSGLKMLVGMAIVLVAFSVFNPLINTRGNTVLFTYLGGRPYTAESMAYGLSIGAMFVSVIMWFGCYHVIMTSDKFTYLFGSLAPSISQLFTMVLRLVPTYQRKLAEIGTARACTGKGMAGSVWERAEASAAVLSALTSWAFENGVVLADSMKSRGYGTGKRTAFALWRFTKRDAALLAVIAALTVPVFVAAGHGAAWVDYVPAIVFAWGDAYITVGIVAYALLLAVPTLIDVRESLIWRISLSKI